jgi:hypothetical protein
VGVWQATDVGKATGMNFIGMGDEVGGAERTRQVTSRGGSWTSLLVALKMRSWPAALTSGWMDTVWQKTVLLFV